MDISVIIPVYNEEKNVLILAGQLKQYLNQTHMKHEIIFIDDGSTDKTFHSLRSMKDTNIKIIQLRKNFGKAVALSVGWQAAKGDIIIQMDGDLQDDPKEIAKFIEAIKDFDMISGWKFKRYDPWTKKIPSKLFNWLTKTITGINIHDFNCGFKCYRKDVIKKLDIYGELHRYIPVLAHWNGFKISEIKVAHHSRKSGQSKYGVSRLFKGFFDLVTIIFIQVYEKRPMHLFGMLGFISMATGFVLGLYISYIKLILGQELGIGRPIVTLTALLIISGIQLISIGLIGELFVRKSSREENKSRYIKSISS